MPDKHIDRRGDRVWQDPALATKFLEGMRGGVPFATEQIDIMLRIIQASQTRVDRFLDLGCGDGILGRTLLAHYPAATGTFLDFSQAMVEAATASLDDLTDRVDVVQADFGTPDWMSAIDMTAGEYDLVVSGFAIHHQPDDRKLQLYGEIHRMLLAGGMFLNLEHVSSRSNWAERAFAEHMIDSLWAYHQRQGDAPSRDEIAREYVNRPDWSANILAPVETQCAWLRDIGYVDVDCFFKAFELSLFGGRKRA